MQAAVERTSTMTTGTAHNHCCVLHHPMASSYAWMVQCCKDVILDTVAVSHQQTLVADDASHIDTVGGPPGALPRVTHRL